MQHKLISGSYHPPEHRSVDTAEEHVLFPGVVENAVEEHHRARLRKRFEL